MTQFPPIFQWAQALPALTGDRSPDHYATQPTLPELEILSVERGICPIATSTIYERTVPIIMAGCMAHEREGYISTSV